MSQCRNLSAVSGSQSIHFDAAHHSGIGGGADLIHVKLRYLPKAIHIGGECELCEFPFDRFAYKFLPQQYNHQPIPENDGYAGGFYCDECQDDVEQFFLLWGYAKFCGTFKWRTYVVCPKCHDPYDISQRLVWMYRKPSKVDICFDCGYYQHRKKSLKALRRHNPEFRGTDDELYAIHLRRCDVREKHRNEYYRKCAEAVKEYGHPKPISDETIKKWVSRWPIAGVKLSPSEISDELVAFWREKRKLKHQLKLCQQKQSQ